MKRIEKKQETDKQTENFLLFLKPETDPKNAETNPKTGNESNVCIHIAEMDQKYSEIRVRPKLIFI